MTPDDAKDIVRRGYDAISYADRGDDAADGNYRRWITIMLLAMVVHARRREPQAFPLNLGLLALAALVAWGRFGPYAL